MLHRQVAVAAMGAALGGAAAVAYSLNQSVKASVQLHPQKLPWNHNGIIDSLDHARRVRLHCQ